MVFSSLTFLLFFLPVTAILYYIPNIGSKFKGRNSKNGYLSYKNTILFIASLVFYAWGEPINILLMLISIVFNYSIGLDIKKQTKNSKHKKILLILALVFDIGLLAIFKYSGFCVDNIKLVTGATFKFNAPVLPIGISFYTFQILSYVIDVYKEKVDAQNNIIDFGLYISMFPQLIAGPIVQYSTIDKQLRGRTESIPVIADGVYLFVIGLAKKVILANSAGAVFEEINSAGASELSAASAWMAIIFYAFQIYFDFSGYSDMAKGLGGIFGFEFPENFEYPYAADSITDFWRRWHITLSTWFRDYVYIPLGGNRCSAGRNIFNLFIVWSLTGLWHGASWNFVLWGIYYFVLLVAEKYVFKNIINKIPKVIKHILTLLLVLFGWVLFSANDIISAGNMFAAMFGANSLTDSNFNYIFTNNIIMFIVMVLFSTPVFTLKKTKNKTVKLITVIGLLVLSIIYLVGESYNPFLYFRF